MKNLTSLIKIKRKNSVYQVQYRINLLTHKKSLKKWMILSSLLLIPFLSTAFAIERVSETPNFKAGYNGKMEYRIKCTMTRSYEADTGYSERLGVVQFHFKSSNGMFWKPTSIDVDGAVAYNVDVEGSRNIKYEDQVNEVEFPGGGSFYIPQKIFIENAKGDRVEFDLSSNQIIKSFLKYTNDNKMNVGYRENETSMGKGPSVRVIENPESIIELTGCDLNNINPGQI